MISIQSKQMSKLYIPGVVSNIRRDSTPYTPIVEAIVNAIEAIDKAGIKDGRIEITVHRSPEQKFALKEDKKEEQEPEIESISIRDNGIGFSDENRDAFDVLYTPQKISLGGKGFGRFFYPLYFQSVSVLSVYKEESRYIERRFVFGSSYKIVDQEGNKPSSEHVTFTELSLKQIKREEGKGKLSRDIKIFAHRITEQLLSYFADPAYVCPKITIHDRGNEVVLNELISSEEDALIQIKKRNEFSVGETTFRYTMFKVLEPRNQKSHIRLVAHNRVVTEKPLDKHITEFSSEFVEIVHRNGEALERNYIVHFYVQSPYLDARIDAERGAFIFADEIQDQQVDMIDVEYEQHGNRRIYREEIEKRMADIAKDIFADDVKTRKEAKMQKVKDYADQHIWLRPYLEDVNLDELKKNNPSEIEIEQVLRAAQYRKDKEIEQDFHKIKDMPYTKAHKAAQKITGKVKEINKGRLAHYMTFRKIVIGLLQKNLERGKDAGVGKNGYAYEKDLHELIFTPNSSSKDKTYYEHNLWLLDERLNFSRHNLF